MDGNKDSISPKVEDQVSKTFIDSNEKPSIGFERFADPTLTKRPLGQNLSDFSKSQEDSVMIPNGENIHLLKSEQTDPLEQRMIRQENRVETLEAENRKLRETVDSLNLKLDAVTRAVDSDPKLKFLRLVEERLNVLKRSKNRSVGQNIEYIGKWLEKHGVKGFGAYGSVAAGLMFVGGITVAGVEGWITWDQITNRLPELMAETARAHVQVSPDWDRLKPSVNVDPERFKQALGNIKWTDFLDLERIKSTIPSAMQKAIQESTTIKVPDVGGTIDSAMQSRQEAANLALERLSAQIKDTFTHAGHAIEGVGAAVASFYVNRVAKIAASVSGRGMDVAGRAIQHFESSQDKVNNT